MDPLIEELDVKGLRNFGLSFGAIVAALFGLFFPWLLELAYPRWPWLLLTGCAGWSFIAPRTLRPFYRLWMRLGIALSKITTPVILGVVYFLIITPTGLIAGLFRKDPMRRNCKENRESFWQDSEQRPASHMDDPF
jgi:hypothetical protein